MELKVKNTNLNFKSLKWQWRLTAARPNLEVNQCFKEYIKVRQSVWTTSISATGPLSPASVFYHPPENHNHTVLAEFV